MKNMKVLLLNPPFKELVIRDNYCCFTSKANYFWAPIDLLAISGMLHKNHFKIKVLDCVAEGISYDEVVDRVRKMKPNFIISMTGTATFGSDKRLFKQLSNIHSFKLILSGNIAAFEPKKVFDECEYVDAIIHNFASLEIIDYLLGNREEFENISFRKNEKISYGHIDLNREVKNINFYIPRHDLFPLDKYQTPYMNQKPMATSMTAYGCPYACDFCIASRLNYKNRSIKEIEKELDYLNLIGVKEIFFQDSTFNANKKFLFEFCELMINKEYKFTWAANIHSLGFTKEVAQKMKDAGCRTVSIGVENASNEILKQNSKATNVKKIEEAFLACQSAGLVSLGYFIIGLPEDSLDSIEKTISFARKLNPTFASFSIATADYGTKLSEKVSMTKLVSKKIDNFDSSSSTNIQLKYLPKKQLDKLITKAYYSFYLRPSKLFELLILSFRNKTIISNFTGGLQLIYKMILRKK